MEIDGNQLENVEKFTYLGCLNTYDLDSKKEILVRIAKATAALSAMDKIWKSTTIHKKLKLEVLKTCVFRVLGQNGSGQNGTDKMVWTKWYTDKMVLDKMGWSKWNRQNRMVKI